MIPGQVVTDHPMRATDRTVADVVVRHPKTLDAAATVGAARAELEDDHVHMLLLTRDGRLLGTLVRDDLATARDGEPALPYAVLAGRTIGPAVRADDALRRLRGRDERRRAVVDDGGRLIGLLCLKRRGTGFCSDHDVATRRSACDILATASGGSLR